MKRFLSGLAAAGATLVVLAAPAAAHEEISPTSIETGKPTFLTLTAANEKKADLTKIAVAAPAGVPFGETTHSPPGWTVERSDATITWSGGKVSPDNFDQWGFEIEGADQPGTLKYSVTLGYADGSSGSAEVDVTAVAASGGEGGGPVATAPPASGPATTAAGSSGTTTSTSIDRPAASSGEGLGVAAIIVSIMAGLVAGLAVLIAMRKPAWAAAAASKAAAPAKPSKSGDKGQGEDW